MAVVGSAVVSLTLLFALHFSFITIVFVNFAKMELEEQRAGRAIRIFAELVLHSQYRLHGRGNSELLSSGQRGFIFSPVSGVLCGCPILLTHQPCSN